MKYTVKNRPHPSDSVEVGRWFRGFERELRKRVSKIQHDRIVHKMGSLDDEFWIDIQEILGE